MKIGFVGCGKLGLMVALTIESRGHEVKGYDVRPEPAEYLKNRSIPFTEDHAEELLASTKMEMASLQELCDWAELLFLAPQTPHAKEFEGITPLPEARADFDYTYLRECVKSVNRCLKRPTTCVIISTLLPGTIEREVLPIIQGKCWCDPAPDGLRYDIHCDRHDEPHYFRLVYEPLFIAMGTVYSDYLNPEFVLIGVHDQQAVQELTEFYATIHDAPLFFTDLKTAEGIKVFYNTFITTKTVLANLYGEMAHRLGMNVDDIFGAISLSTDRLLSPKYLQAGMGDGGGCHPRDNIALSYIARRENLSFDFFDALMTARERHCEWLADLVIRESYNVLPNTKQAPIFILGRSFKPETNIETGSPAILLSNILQDRGISHEHVEDLEPRRQAVYFIATRHAKYQGYSFPAGSTVIDPFRYLDQEALACDGVRLVSIGGGAMQPHPAEIAAQ